MEQSTALSKVLAVDTKISRAEVIDLIMEEMIDEVETELNSAQEELNELESKKFSFEQVKHILARTKFEVNVDTYARGDGTRANHSVNFAGSHSGDEDGAVTERDKVVGDHITRVLELSQRVNELRKQKQNIDGNKRVFRATIMKKVLEGTQEGRNVLAQIGQLKVQLRKQLSAGKSKR